MISENVEVITEEPRYSRGFLHTDLTQKGVKSLITSIISRSLSIVKFNLFRLAFLPPTNFSN